MNTIRGHFNKDTSPFFALIFAEEAHCFAANDDTWESLPRDKLIQICFVGV